jgi:hypothetical protein
LRQDVNPSHPIPCYRRCDMIPKDASSWSKDRINQEIQNRRQYIQTLEDSIRHHIEEAERLHDDFQGHGLEKEKYNLEDEILQLTKLL